MVEPGKRRPSSALLAPEVERILTNLMVLLPRNEGYLLSSAIGCLVGVWLRAHLKA